MTDDWHWEPAIKSRKEQTKKYKRDDYSQRVNRMLNSYQDDSKVNEVDARLIIGMATKLPVDDRDIVQSILV